MAELKVGDPIVRVRASEPQRSIGLVAGDGDVEVAGYVVGDGGVVSTSRRGRRHAEAWSTW